MDYNRIITNGLLDPTTKKHFDLYLYREYQNAKEKHYTLTEFFSGLMHSIQQMHATIKNKREDALKSLNEDIDFTKTHPPETEEEAKQELSRLNARANFILNSELTIDIENENYKGKISFETLEHLLDIITFVFERAQKESAVKNNTEKLFSVPLWCAIFYYADTLKYFAEQYKIDRMKGFIETHSIGSTLATFKKTYYDTVKAINNNTYKAENLKEIIPFVTENYKLCVPKIESDITIIEENEFD